MILARYVLSGFFPPFAFGITVFSFVLILDKLFDLADLILNRGAPVLVIARLFGAFFPTILPLTIPMSVLLAVLVSYGRLAQDGEITAIRAGGLSLWKISWPVFLLAAAVSAALIPFNREVSPRANAYFRNAFSRIAQADPLLQMEPRQFFEVRNLKLYAHEVDPGGRALKDVIVYRMRTGGDPADRITARRGRTERSPERFRLHLEDGQLERYQAGDAARVLHIRFETYSIDMPIGADESESSVDIRSLTSPALTRMLRDGEILPRPGYEIESERELRHALALAPLALAALGVPLGMVLQRGGRTMGFGVSAGILFLYYLVLVLGLSLGHKGTVRGGWAVWVANGLSLMAGAWLLRRRLRQ